MRSPDALIPYEPPGLSRISGAFCMALVFQTNAVTFFHNTPSVPGADRGFNRVPIKKESSWSSASKSEGILRRRLRFLKGRWTQRVFERSSNIEGSMRNRVSKGRGKGLRPDEGDRNLGVGYTNEYGAYRDKKDNRDAPETIRWKPGP